MKREEISFDRAWLYHEGELEQSESRFKTAMYLGAKTERMLDGPASRNYVPIRKNGVNPENWVTVDLPHDPIIEQTPRAENNEALGFFSYPNAWYRKTFSLSGEDRSKRLTLLFEGVSGCAEVWINGCRMAQNSCGYTSFEVDFTDVALFEEENLVVIHQDLSPCEGWWYQGGGIYRHVILRKTAMQSIDLWGVFAHNVRQEESRWYSTIFTELRCDSFEDADVTLVTTLLDGQKQPVCTHTQTLSLEGKSVTRAECGFTVDAPALWDLDAPQFYYVRSALLRDGEEIDCVETRYGYREAVFDPERGFLLNGRPVKIKGVCCHQDWGMTGKAVPANVQRHRLRLLKEMGVNGYRCSHYPQHPETMDALDELGFVVMDESRWFESTPDGRAQLEMLIRRDRNHPSVVLWSLGNEEVFFAEERGKRIAQTLYRMAKRLDDTRPVMVAVDRTPAKAPVFDVMDVIGINYNLGSIDELHQKYPDKAIISSENCAVGSSRLWMLPHSPERGYLNVKDVPGGYFGGRERTWRFLWERPWLCGGFQWAGIEHRGEAVWPRLCSQSGALDLFLQKKDAFYQNQSHWLDSPMVHIVGHWNLPYEMGNEVDVWVYTNCEEAELFLDGESLGRQKVEYPLHLSWRVRYRPGQLEAVGYCGGQEVARDRLCTSGKPAKLRLELENGGDLARNGRDAALVRCVCLDENGNFVPDAEPFVHIAAEGMRLIGTGSDVSDHVPPRSPDRRMRAGIVSAAFAMPDGGNARLRVIAWADGLEGDSIVIEQSGLTKPIL